MKWYSNRCEVFYLMNNYAACSNIALLLLIYLTSCVPLLGKGRPRNPSLLPVFGFSIDNSYQEELNEIVFSTYTYSHFIFRYKRYLVTTI